MDKLLAGNIFGRRLSYSRAYTHICINMLMCIQDLATGVVLCDLATLIEETAQHPTDEQRLSSQVAIFSHLSWQTYARGNGRSLWRSLKFYVGEGVKNLIPNRRAKRGSFLARDNVAVRSAWNIVNFNVYCLFSFRNDPFL